MTNYPDKFRLDGKVAFVCGGLGLIGTEVVKALATSGAETVILDVDRKKGLALQKEMLSQGYQVSFEHFDITNLTGLEKNLDRLARRYKKVDAWINLAYPRTKDWGNTVEQLNLKSFRKNVDMHLNSSVWSARKIALIMKKNKTAGTIIHFGSIYGVQANDFTVYDGTSMSSPMAYSAIKGGIINATRYLAAYFGPHGIRVNALCPGGVRSAGQPKRFVKNYEHKVPLKRMGTPGEIASATVFLASEASSYVTGATLMVDGGWTIV
jgi:NAD(P)-dependent dehydrogenase (short-subunit alcohol dehydrogenase family)